MLTPTVANGVVYVGALDFIYLQGDVLAYPTTCGNGCQPLATLVLGGANAAANAFISREEFAAYGSTTFGSYARKRYRFAGKELDEESGLSYFGARYYAPWLARWTSADPAGPIDGPNLYAYARDNPVTKRDLDENIYHETAMEVPYNGNPYAEDLVKGYWSDVRKLVGTRLR